MKKLQRIDQILGFSVIVRVASIATIVIIGLVYEPADAASLLLTLGVVQVTQSWFGATFDASALARTAAVEGRQKLLLSSLAAAPVLAAPATLQSNWTLAICAAAMAPVVGRWASDRAIHIVRGSIVKPYGSTLARDACLVGGVLLDLSPPVVLAASHVAMAAVVFVRGRALLAPSFSVAIGSALVLGTPVLLRVAAAESFDAIELVTLEQATRIGGAISLLATAGIGPEIQRQVAFGTSGWAAVRTPLIRLSLLSAGAGAFLAGSASLVPDSLSSVPGPGLVSIALVSSVVAGGYALSQRVLLASGQRGAFAKTGLAALTAFVFAMSVLHLFDRVSPALVLVGFGFAQAVGLALALASADQLSLSKESPAAG